MRRTRSLPWLATLALILNVLGSPMAWAHALGSHAESGAASQMAPACHGEPAQPHGPGPAPEMPPCCDGGGCHCAAPALSIYSAGNAIREPHPSLPAPYETTAQPTHPPDDTLRPPIR